MAKVQITGKLKKLIEGVALALATVDKSGQPNVVAVACVKVVSRNKLLITDNFMNKTKANILANSQVALAVWSRDEEIGYQLKGGARYLASGKWKRAVDEMEENKGMAHKGSVLVTVKEIWDLGEPKLISRESDYPSASSG